METPISDEDVEKIKKGVRDKYNKVAVTPEGCFSYPTGLAGLKALGYDSEMLRALPKQVAESYCGVGNPFSLGNIKKGEMVLDIGCGAGVDTLIAALMAGPSGKAVGIDLVPEMLEKAGKNMIAAGVQNVQFMQKSVEELDLSDESFDVVISNGVFNLVPYKLKTLEKSFRLLKPGGWLLIADQILVGNLEKDLKTRIDTWFQWEGGAIPGKDFLDMIHQAGFQKVELVAETGFNSSAKTKGVLIRAVKPSSLEICMEKAKMGDSASKYQAFFDQVYADGVIDRKTKHLIALGASLAAGCDPWTRYSLAVARELGASEEELAETMAVAMTVGATKIKILHENTLRSLDKTEAGGIQAVDNENSEDQSGCSTWNS